jgi:hypothetical protein
MMMVISPGKLLSLPGQPFSSVTRFGRAAVDASVARDF